MRRFFLTVVCAILATFSGWSADAVYRNTGTIDCGSAPQIDALVFINDGNFCALPITGSQIGANPGIPYTTQDTLWFTNNNLMQSGPGFWLDYVTDDGLHHPAAAIVNNNGNANSPATIFGDQFVLLSATNLVNRGILEIGATGLMQLSGNNVNLARGGLLVDPTIGGGGGGCEPAFFYRFFISPTNYGPENGLDDLYWGIGSDTNVASDQIVQQFGNQLIVQSPSHA